MISNDKLKYTGMAGTMSSKLNVDSQFTRFGWTGLVPGDDEIVMNKSDLATPEFRQLIDELMARVYPDGKPPPLPVELSAAEMAHFTDPAVRVEVSRLKVMIHDPAVKHRDKAYAYKALRKFVMSRERQMKKELGETLKTYETRIHTLDQRIAAGREVVEWMRGGLRLEKPTGSSYHRFTTCIRDQGVIAWSDPDELIELVKRNPGKVSGGLKIDELGDLSEFKIFVVEHDWAGAFKNAVDFHDGEYRMPFDRCCFEFRVSGKRVIIFTMDDKIRTPLIETKAGWIGTPGVDSLAEILIEKLEPQIRAVCIALEAEVAENDTVRAPHKLNRAREKRGELPLYDYHVVKLAARRRQAALPDDHEITPGRPRRMHFVRGHWRHYETHRTWIEWHLRGDWDLGFIEKEYRL